MITDDHYNRFARTLASRFAARASGLDAESARLGVRPADHVLTGFLTPGGTDDEHEPGASADRDDGEEGDAAAAALGRAAAVDLPQDSAYELSNVGLEWLAPEAALTDLAELTIEARLHVYVR